MINIETPEDILNFMDNIDYGYIDLMGNKHINTLQDYETNYRTLSIEQILKNNIGTCIEQVSLMHTLLNKLNIPSKMFCIRGIGEKEYTHCVVLYYDENGVHQIEHPHGDRKGIYHFKDEQTALNEINKVYTKMYNGIQKPTVEYDYIAPGLSIKEFNEYIDSLEEKKEKTHSR